jgi:hypothetical protein
VKNNTTGAVTSTESGAGGTASASVTVNNVASPTIAKAFGAASIPLNGSTSLTFTITNPNATALTGVGFTDSLPAGLVVSTPNGLSGSCGGGTVIAVAGSGSIIAGGASLAGSANCTFSVNVTGTTVGVKNNITSAIISTESGAGGTASASTTVVQTGTLTGHVFRDDNGDGIQNAGEPNISGAVVIVTTSIGGTLTTSTDVNGDYSLIVPVGATTVDVTDPAGYTLMTANDPQTVNVIATGTATTPVGYQPSGAVASVSVPTMNEWGMIIFILLAGLGSTYYIRKKRV